MSTSIENTSYPKLLLVIWLSSCNLARGEATVALFIFLLGWVPLAGCKERVEVGVTIVDDIDHTRGCKSFKDIALFYRICNDLRDNAEELDDGFLL